MSRPGCASLTRATLARVLGKLSLTPFLTLARVLGKLSLTPFLRPVERVDGATAFAVIDGINPPVVRGLASFLALNGTQSSRDEAFRALRC